MGDFILNLSNVQVVQDGNLIFPEVNLKMNQGDFIYLIGKTGTGKSSLMRILYGDLTLKHGKCRIVGFDLEKLSQRKIPFLRRKLGVVFQDLKLLNDRSVFENLAFVLKATGWKDSKEIETQIYKVLKRVDIQTKAYKMPFQLSGGEQQRVAIARALLNDPDLILADEPTGNLDPQTSIEVMEVLESIHQDGKSILMATHDYGLILKFPQRTFKCEHGKFFEIDISK